MKMLVGMFMALMIFGCGRVVENRTVKAGELFQVTPVYGFDNPINLRIVDNNDGSALIYPSYDPFGPGGENKFPLRHKVRFASVEQKAVVIYWHNGKDLVDSQYGFDGDVGAIYVFTSKGEPVELESIQWRHLVE
jgi:hypothetical protein